MGRKRKRPRVRTPPRAVPVAPPRERDLPAKIAAGALLVAILCSGLAVDTGAEASFEAPKRLTSLFCIVVAAGMLAFSALRNPLAGRPLSSIRNVTLLLAAAALGWALVSALASAHRGIALDASRTILLYALLLPIGASRAVERRKGLLLATFLAVAAINAVVSILQARGLYQPFPLVTEFGSRESTGAYVGNVGYLAVALALAAVASLGVALSSRRPALRAASGTLTLLFIGGLLVNRNLTSLSALLVGAAVLGFALFGRRALLPTAAVVGLLAFGIAAYRPMRERVKGAVAAARAGDWNQLVTYRVGAWKAAVAMTRERPVLGYGPGTFGAEYVAHRLAVEISSRKRYDNPLRTSSYSEAHCDYLQPFAEAGIPAGLAVLGAAAFLFLLLARSARRPDGTRDAEAILLLAFLGAGGAAALTWFPMQRPISAVPLLIAAGRAWRIAGRAEGAGKA